MKLRRLFCAFLVVLCIGSLVLQAEAASKPAAPSLSIKNYVSNGKLRLTWTEEDGAAKYKVYRSTSKSSGYKCVKTTSSTGYTDSDAKVGVTYYYYVKSVSAKGKLSGASNKVSGARKLARPDVTVSGVSDSGKIKISWEKVSGASSYRVYRSTNKKTWTLVKKTKTTSYTDTEAKAGTKYYYRVKAIASRSAGNSAYSSVKSRTCDLARPTVTVSNTSSGQVKLTWKKISGASKYYVYRATSKSGSYTRVKSTTATSYTDTTGTTGKTYYYKVKAISSNSDANSAYSSVKSGKAANTAALTLSAKLNSSDVPYLTWNKVSGATKYRVYRSRTRTGGYSLVTTRTTLSYANSKVPEGTTLYYKVKALNSSGKVLATSNVASVTTPLPAGETFKTRYVSVPMVRLYELPDSSSDSIRVRYMEEVQLGSAAISGESSTWYRVKYQGNVMYMWKEKGVEVLTTAKSPSSYTGNNQIQQEVLDLAMEISNNWKTVYAHEQSNGIANSDGVYGFDCSGFASYVLESVMQKYVPTYNLSAAVTVMHKTTDIYNAGYPGELNAQAVTVQNLQPGDVLFFTCDASGSATTSIGHCGIYLGNNEFVHSTDAWSDAVCVMPLSDRFLDTLHSIRRYLPATVTPANTEATLSGPYKNYKVYSRMDPDSGVVATIADGETFTLLFTNSGTTWAYVRTQGGVEGFTRAEYLS